MSQRFEVQGWQRTIERAQTPTWKRAVYRVAAPALSAAAARHLRGEVAHPALRRYLGSRGFPVEHRERWVERHQALAGATVLVQGTGSGWDAVRWARRSARLVLGTDLYPFPDWKLIPPKYPSIAFVNGDLEHMPFGTSSVDVVVSDAVYEHCRDLDSVLAETRRVLRPSGIVYAGYGPLWCSPGGDHFSGRGGLESVYNHLRLSPGDYRRYLDAHRLESEDFQAGARYIELDLFSRLTTDQYLEAYTRAGFEVVELMVEVSSEGVRYANRFPAEFEDLARRFGHDNLLVRANLVILRPAGGDRCVGS